MPHVRRPINHRPSISLVPNCLRSGQRERCLPLVGVNQGFLHEYDVQLQHLPPNVVLQLVGFVVVCEAFLGIEPNKDLFRRVFEVKTRKAHGFDGSVLALVGEMNIQMHYVMKGP